MTKKNVPNNFPSNHFRACESNPDYLRDFKCDFCSCDFFQITLGQFIGHKGNCIKNPINLNIKDKCELCGLNTRGMNRKEIYNHDLTCIKNPKNQKEVICRYCKKNLGIINRREKGAHTMNCKKKMDAEGDFICRFCNKNIGQLTRGQRGSHTRNCEDNPEKFKDYECIHCGEKFKQFSFGQRIAHSSNCSFNPDYKTDFTCQYCLGKFFQMTKGEKSGHIQCCIKNPFFLNQINEIRKKNKDFLKGKNKEEQLEIINNIFSERNFYKAKKVYHKTFEGKEIICQGTWELALAKRLDFLKIKYDRGRALEVFYGGRKHSYFPDFFLEEYNLFLEVKWKRLYEKDLEKNIAIQKAYKNIKYIFSKEDCENFSI